MATEFLKDFYQNYFQELDDHGILMKFFEDFDQNSGSKHQFPTIQMTIKFFKNQTLVKFFQDLTEFYKNDMTMEFL